MKPYYERFLAALPDVKALAEAPEDVLLKLWEGLGYYNRVRNMQKAARQIMEEYGGVFPDRYEDILSPVGDRELYGGGCQRLCLRASPACGGRERAAGGLPASGQQGGHHEGLCEAEDGGGAAGGDPRRRGQRLQPGAHRAWGAGVSPGRRAKVRPVPPGPPVPGKERGNPE